MQSLPEYAITNFVILLFVCLVFFWFCWLCYIIFSSGREERELSLFVVFFLNGYRVMPTEFWYVLHDSL